MASGRSRSYGGAQTVSVIFKIFAGLILIGGVVSAISVANNNNSTFGYSQDTGGEVVAIIGGAVLGAAAVLFFAYVLDLLVGIQRNTVSAAFAPPGASTGGSHGQSGQVSTLQRAAVFPEAGWYDDPWQISRVRYWDGSEWTGRVQE
jgi:hypothetical protein